MSEKYNMYENLAYQSSKEGKLQYRAKSIMNNLLTRARKSGKTKYTLSFIRSVKNSGLTRGYYTNNEIARILEIDKEVN